MFTICLALVITASIIVDTLRIGISPMPTGRKVRKALLQVLPKKPPKIIYELGCGFGTLSIYLARHYPATRVVAFEKAFVPFLVSQVASLFVPNLEVRWVDFLTIDLREADLLICYLFPGGMKALAKRPMKGTLISHTFSLPGYQPHQEMVAGDLYRTKIYSYEFF